jgi:predicted PurR-regulated permease PerM
MQTPLSEKTQRIARLVLVFGLALLGAWIAFRFLPALLWAGIIAVAVDPLHLKLRVWLKGPHRIVIPCIITAVVALAVLVPLALGVTQAAREAHDVMVWIADARANGVPVPEWVVRLPFGADAVRGWWQAHLATPAGADEQFHALRDMEWLRQSQTIGSGIVRRAVIFAFTLLTLFFVLRDRDGLLEQARRAADKAFGVTGERVGVQALRSVRGTIDGLVLVGLGVGAIMAVAYFVLGVPHPIMLGAATAIAAMIPFGAPLIFVIAALLLLLNGSVGGAVAVLVIGTVVMFVADHFIRPALIGGATRLPFLWVLIGILGGVETMGLLGLFIGPAAMAVLVMLWREYLENGSPSDATD